MLSKTAWQRHGQSRSVVPAAHAFLEHNCAACHTPVKGVEATNCIVCHANNESLLQRQPTAFHANVGSCGECHREHQGRDQRPTDMDHRALARIGFANWKTTDADGEDNGMRKDLLDWIANHGPRPQRNALTARRRRS